MTTGRLVSVGSAVVVSLGTLVLMALDPMGVQIRLASITVDFETLPGVGNELALRLPRAVKARVP